MGSRRAAYAIAMCALLGAGCGEATHTVGKLKSKATVVPVRDAGGSKTDDARAGSGGTLHIDAGKKDASNPSGWPCALEAARKRLDLYILVDTEIALPDPSARAGLGTGLMDYFEDPRAAGVGVGVDYFEAATCRPSDYETPTVAIDLLPDNRDALVDSLSRLNEGSFIGQSRMSPAIDGSLQHAGARVQTLHFKTALVLVSDGYTSQSCSADPATAPEITATGLPTVQTYVLALMGTNPATNLSNLQALDAIAQAGGTGSARQVDAVFTSGQSSMFADTMVEEIQRDAEPCEYSVPDGVLDGQTPLASSPDGAAFDELSRVGDASACTDSAYYVTEDADSGVIWAVLCDSTCAAVKAERATLHWLQPCN